MQIHQLSVAKKKARKRIGRGGKRGTTAGRGSNGQKSRSGASVDPLFEGGRSTFLERLKKVRGFKSIHPKKCVVTLTALEYAYADGDTVTLGSLVEKNIVPKNAFARGVKVVATGVLKKKLTLGADIAASETAKTSFHAVAE
ncbi:MAG: 50S ribosomal protein L15 [Candidatus Moranbacteria bacterium RIFCSPHIGHO2_12_FULL_54_9]|nr:MAG: 50S ribosomal protein L15 [Candidatus Moranbacteria bacterium RIFCSPHIGHO2_01_FULL_54_31]OGI26140.1 MAG: 50S ribosomal protein L15 [Candidatus Moranbacteria bacterium RIFCSPHIGHO2_12_FULL_54_9]